MSDFKGAFSFHIPAEEFEQTLREGPIWKLGSVDVDADDHDRPEDVLLKTKLLTQPGHTKNPEMRAWASSHPQMKEVQCILGIHNRNMPRGDLYGSVQVEYRLNRQYRSSGSKERREHQWEVHR